MFARLGLVVGVCWALLMGALVAYDAQMGARAFFITGVVPGGLVALLGSALTFAFGGFTRK